jgi:ribosomal-protein-alanine N-acetyltransferase
LFYPTDPLLYPSLKKRRKTENITLDTNFNIRLFNTTDTSQVMAINRSCLPENYNQAFYLMLYYRFPKTFIVASASDTVVGYIMCRIELGLSEMQRFNLIKKGHVVSLAVLPEYRGKGLGKGLVSNALKGMLGYGAKESYLEVRLSNLAAIRLYEKLNFNVVRTRRSYYKDGEDAFVMARKVP